MSRPDRTDSPPEVRDRRRVRRETLAFALGTLLVAGVGVLGLWIASFRTLREQFGEHLTGIARAAARRIDPELHGRLRDPAQRNGPDYLRAVEPLREIRALLPEVHYIYTMVRDGDRIRFVLDAADPGDHDGDGIDDQAALWEVYADEDPAMQLALGDGTRAGVPAATDRPYGDKWGSFMTGWAPLVDARGQQFGAVGVDVDASVYLALQAQARRVALVGLAPALLLIGLLTWGFRGLRSRSLAAQRGADRAERALQAEQQRLANIIERVEVGTWQTDFHPDGRAETIVDARWAEMLGRRAEDLNPLTTENLFPVLLHPDDAPIAWGESQAAMEQPDRLLEFDVRMRHADGRWIWTGVRGRVTEWDEQGRPRRMVGTQTDVSARKAMEAELAAAAYCDRLTGLANRARFMEWLQAAVERTRSGQQSGLAVLFLDFDRFKLVNDAMGHAAGDELLRDISARLREAVGIGAAPLSCDSPRLLARFGGDEFLVLLNDADDVAGVQKLTDRMLTVLARTYTVHGREVYSNASIGIVTAGPCAAPADELVRNADLAMYEAKRQGRARAVLFDDLMRARLTRFVSIETGLRQSLATEAFSLVYQPIVELASGRITSVEALARWRHPELGPISPAEFIPVAEESGLIVALGQRVLAEACRALASWRAEAPGLAPETVCVNLSRTELALGERLLRQISDALLDAGLPPQCLRIEVTERDAMRDPAVTMELMQQLRNMGVQLAMDDFGTGTSSLGCLREYPFDLIKIDRSFISDLTLSADVLAVIHAAVTLVQNLGKTSVAEGVETAQQVAVLQSLGCHYAQGYHFSPPLTAAELLAHLDPHRGRQAAG